MSDKTIKRLKKNMDVLEALLGLQNARIYRVDYEGQLAFSEYDEWEAATQKVLANGDALAAVEIAKKTALNKKIDLEPDGDFDGYSGALYSDFRLREVTILAETGE